MRKACKKPGLPKLSIRINSCQDSPQLSSTPVGITRCDSDSHLMTFCKETSQLSTLSGCYSSHLVEPPSYYLQGPVQVLPGLYLGTSDHAQDTKQLLELGIHSILNVASELDTRPSTNGPISYLHLGWSHNQPNIESYFDRAFSFIDLARFSCSRGILVHCQQGISRSASLVIGYLMYTLGYNSSQAYNFLKSRSPSISPNLMLFSQLVHYEKLKAGPQSTTIKRAVSSSPYAPVALTSPLELKKIHRKSNSTTLVTIG